MNLDSVLGGKFSIISKSGVRYVGSLLGIEGEQKTLSFEKVASFGSEGRIGNGRDIPPSNNIFDFIIFKAEEIAHLKLIEPPPPKVPQQEPFTDPAIVQTGPRQTSSEGLNNQNETRPPYVSEQSRDPEIAPDNQYSQSSQDVPFNSQPFSENNNSERFNDKNNHNDFQGGQRNYHSKRGSRGNQRNGPRNNRGRPGLNIPEEDFDFQSFNAQFNKEDFKKEFDSGSNSTVPQFKGAYDKKTSFFDDISCDSKNKAEGQNSESFTPRKNNYETFGINSNYNRHRSNQGNHRGSRGRNNYHSRHNGQGHSNRGNSNQHSMNSNEGNNERTLGSGATEQ